MQKHHKMLKFLTFACLAFFIITGCETTRAVNKPAEQPVVAVTPPTNVVQTQNYQKDNTIYQFKVTSLEGDTIDFARFKGKKILIVNTASKCKYTPQYEYLEKLHKT